MTEKGVRLERLSNMSKPVPMKLFSAWEVDRTPPNCIPRLCSLTITRLSLLTPLPADLSSLSLAVKMQSSKRTLRSHEIPVPQSALTTSATATSSMGGPISSTTTTTSTHPAATSATNNSTTATPTTATTTAASATTGTTNSGGTPFGSGGIGMAAGTGLGVMAGGGVATGGGTNNTPQAPALLETDLELHFSLQYPHFIKRDGNRLLIILQRRKKYKTRTILGYKTLAEGVIKMDAVLQKSMDMTIELTSTGKSGRQGGVTVATLRAERVSSIPVDQDNKNNNSLLLADRGNEYSDEDEENEFSSAEDNYDGHDGIGLTGYDAKHDYAATKRDMRKYRKLERHDADDVALGPNPVDSDSEFENLKEKGSRAKISRQRNFKQKIVSLLKRFKVPEELEGSVNRTASGLRGERDLDALFQELESLSCGEGDDSGPDMDSLSVGSTPKPSLRPFFTNSRNILHDNLLDDPEGSGDQQTRGDSDHNRPQTAVGPTPDKGSEWRNDSSGNENAQTDPEAPNSDSANTGGAANNTGSPPRGEKESSDRRPKLFRVASTTPASVGKKKQTLSLSADPPKSSLDTCLSPTNVEPRKSLLDQLTRTFATEEAVLPDVLSIIGPPEPASGFLTQRLTPVLTAAFRPIFSPHNTAEVKAVMQALMNKIHKYCNTTAKPPTTIKVLLLGGDWLEGAVLRHYVDLLGVRPPDWVNHIRFYMVPIGASTVSRYLCALDSSYGAMFGVDSWYQHLERAATLDPTQGKADILEITNRIQRYLHTAGPCTQIPIAEAMVNYKDEDSCQIFVPFISDVKIGYADTQPQLSLDLDESSLSSALLQQSSGNVLSSSPPSGGRSSPPIPTTPQSAGLASSAAAQSEHPLELQLDYWPIIRPGDKAQTKMQTEQSKNSIKSAFRNLQVYRLPLFPQPGDVTHGLIVNYSTKEKKQKIMRLGKKKEKDRELEKQCIDGIARLICSPKQSHPIPLRVYIDGTEWTGVKFFQLSSQWQTHVKNFPVALIGTAHLSSADHHHTMS